MNSLDDIRKCLSDGSLLRLSVLDDVDMDALLDKRERDEFEDDWLKAAEDVQANWNDFADAQSAESVVDEIRELAFRKCYEVTQSADVSGYVSDDFELLAKAALMSLDSSYLQQMKRIYSEGNIPC